METNKREVHPALRKILALDVELSKKFVLFANNYLPLRSLRVHYKMLEISCHGIPWFAFWLAFTWLFNNPDLIEMQVNILFGLTIDIFAVAILKAYTRRRRPVANKDDMMGQIGPDKFSFPSGHCSRAVFVTFFFIYLYTVPIIFWPSLLAWCTAVCVSRILLERHHILDVLAGVALGFVNGFLLCLLWIPADTAKWFMSFLTEEKLDGGEYHV